MDEKTHMVDPRLYHLATQEHKKEFEALQAENKQLREYVVHKENCPARRMFYIRECPHCGSRKNHWQGGGPAFEAYRVCEECDGPAYIPEERKGECDCGLEAVYNTNTTKF